MALLYLKLTLTLTLRLWQCVLAAGYDMCRGTCHGMAMTSHDIAMACGTVAAVTLS